MKKVYTGYKNKIILDVCDRCPYILLEESSRGLYVGVFVSCNCRGSWGETRKLEYKTNIPIPTWCRLPDYKEGGDGND
jgi:hypothetical protein